MRTDLGRGLDGEGGKEVENDFFPGEALILDFDGEVLSLSCCGLSLGFCSLDGLADFSRACEATGEFMSDMYTDLRICLVLHDDLCSYLGYKRSARRRHV